MIKTILMRITLDDDSSALGESYSESSWIRKLSSVVVVGVVASSTSTTSTSS